MNLKFLFRVSLLIGALLFVAVINSFAQGVIIDTSGANTVISVPSITIPKNDPLFFSTQPGLAALMALFTILATYLANLIPGFRKLNLDKGTKALALGIGVVVIFTQLRGGALLPALFTYVFSAIQFWSHLGYKVVGQPLLGSTDQFAANIAEAAVNDPNVPYDGVKKNGSGEFGPELPADIKPETDHIEEPPARFL